MSIRIRDLSHEQSHSPACPLCGGAVLPPSTATESITVRARRLIAADLHDAPEDIGRFFATLFAESRAYRTTTTLAYDLAIAESTLNSRFFRAQLPTPKQYVIQALMVRLADALQRMSLRRATDELELSSATMAGRAVRMATGLSAPELARRFTGEQRLDVFRAQLILPYVDTLRTFRPLVSRSGPMWRVA